MIPLRSIAGTSSHTIRMDDDEVEKASTLAGGDAGTITHEESGLISGVLLQS